MKVELDNLNLDGLISLKIPNFGYLLKKTVIIDRLDYDGNLSTLTIDKYNILSNNNTLIFDEWLDDLNFDIKGDFCIFSVKHKYGAFNKEGDIVVKPLYDKLYYDSEDVFMAKHNNKFGFVTANGHLTPIIFEDAGFFYDEVAAVKYNFKWGFISKYCKIDNPNDDTQYVIPPQYDKAEDFEDGLSKVCQNSKILLIDRNNNIIKQKIKRR